MSQENVEIVSDGVSRRSTAATSTPWLEFYDPDVEFDDAATVPDGSRTATRR